MQFDNKIRRAQRAQRKALGLDGTEDQSRRKLDEKEKLEKGDWFALLFSAFYSIFLPAVGVLGAFVLLIFLLFGLF